MKTLVAAVQQVIKERLQDHPVLIWYDDGGTLADVVPRAVPDGVELVTFEGSYLAIRAHIEREDPTFQRRWLIYVPEQALDPSWLRDYELFGHRLDLTLERLLVERLGLKSNAQMRKLLAGPRGRALAANWDTAMAGLQPPIRQEQVVKGLLAVAFALGPGFSLGRAVLEYATYPDLYGQQLTRMGLARTFAQAVRSELGLSQLPGKTPVPAERLAAAVLFSELVVRSGGLGVQEFAALLPDEPKRPLWAKLADDWRENSRLRPGFLRWSQELEAKYSVRDKLAGLDALAKVKSFRAVDDVLMEELAIRVKAGGTQALVQQASTIRRLAEERIKTPWAETGPGAGWRAVAAAAQLIRDCQTATSALTGMYDASIEEYLARYTRDDGWWVLDEAYRTVAEAEGQVPPTIAGQFLEPAAAAYGEWLRKLGVHFAEAVSKASAWPAGEALWQGDFWDKLVMPKQVPTAILLLDALRYDLGTYLYRLLGEKGHRVQRHTMLTAVPSCTKLGMAALLPRQGKRLCVMVNDGDLRVSLNDQVPLTTKEQRKQWLQQVLGDGVCFFELDQVVSASPHSLKANIGGRHWTIVTSRDIDLAGTFLADVDASLLRSLVERVATGVTRLHEAGVERVVIGTDHGFLLLPKGFNVDFIEGPPASPDVARDRRYVLGKLPALPKFLSFPLEAVRLGGKGKVAFPRGLTCLSLQGGLGAFLHKGLTLQETVVMSLVSETAAPTVAQKVKVVAQLPTAITNAVFLIELTPEGPPTMFDVSRLVKIEVYSADELVAESEPVTVYREPVKARVVLRQIPQNVALAVVDVETQEILARRTVPVQLAGYDELL